jgi:hypothetical protein
MTITRTITKKETQEIEITFPVYKKLSTAYYKVISEKESIQILPPINCISVCIPYELDEILSEGTDITEDEFNEKFIEVFNKIKAYKPQYSLI